MDSLLESALEYASFGLKVFPVRGKTPQVPSWKEDASSNEKVIKAWFGKNGPEGITGIAAIIPDWALVLDIDGEPGEKSIKEHNLDVPITVEALSGRPGGRHLWYLQPEGKRVARKIRTLPGLDVLVNGYVIMPPSSHPRGGVYSWPEGVAFSLKAMEQAPDWISIAVDHSESDKKGVDPQEFFQGLPDGQKAVGLFRYACYLRQKGRDNLEAKILLHRLAEVSNCTKDRFDPKSSNSVYAIVDRVWKTYEGADKDEEAKEKEVHIRSLADMQGASFTEPRFLVKDLLPLDGYTIIVSEPKKGKSLLADCAAACIATGKPFLGRQVEQTGVLVLDLEQQDVNAYFRWRKIFEGLGVEKWPSNLYTAYTWPQMDAGGLDKIKEVLSEHPSIRVILIDSLYNIVPEGESSGSSVYYREAKMMRKFLPIARDYGIAFFIVHHARKGETTDSIARGSGSYGITGPAAAYWDLQRKSGSKEATLQVTGRNVPDSTTKIWLGEDLLWRQSPA